MADQNDLLITEVKGHHKRKRKLVEFTHSSTYATILMVSGALIAFIVANTGLYFGYEELWDTYIGFNIGSFSAQISIGHFINDALMAMFFLLVGLEIKYEMTVGELTSLRKALLPIIAAFGGAVVPALVYILFNGNTPYANGWGVPTANDIAFCLGILALLGSRVPVGLRVFLSSLTIVDDIIAIAVIAVFYTAELNIFWLIMALLTFASLIFLNRSNRYSLAPYLILGVVLWVCFLFSGVHATIAGVLLALTIPVKSQIKHQNLSRWFGMKAVKAEERYQPSEPTITQKKYLGEISQVEGICRLAQPPLTRLENKLHPGVYFLILPIFALANAGVRLVGENPLEIITHPVALGVFFGLLVGKPLGILLASFITVKLKISDLPEGVNWRHMIGVSILGGVGFTMAIFVTNLAFDDAAIVTIAKAAILLASIIAGLIGFLALWLEAARQTALEEEEDDDEAEAAS